MFSKQIIPVTSRNLAGALRRDKLDGLVYLGAQYNQDKGLISIRRRGVFLIKDGGGKVPITPEGYFHIFYKDTSGRSICKRYRLEHEAER